MMMVIEGGYLVSDQELLRHAGRCRSSSSATRGSRAGSGYWNRDRRSRCRGGGSGGGGWAIHRSRDRGRRLVGRWRRGNRSRGGWWRRSCGRRRRCCGLCGLEWWRCWCCWCYCCVIEGPLVERGFLCRSLGGGLRFPVGGARGRLRVHGDSLSPHAGKRLRASYRWMAWKLPTRMFWIE